MATENVEHTPDGPLTRSGWLGISLWDLELDDAIWEDDDDKLTRLLVYREMWLSFRECMAHCNRCDRPFHEEDGCYCWNEEPDGD